MTELSVYGICLKNDEDFHQYKDKARSLGLRCWSALGRDGKNAYVFGDVHNEANEKQQTKILVSKFTVLGYRADMLIFNEKFTNIF